MFQQFLEPAYKGYSSSLSHAPPPLSLRSIQGIFSNFLTLCIWGESLPYCTAPPSLSSVNQGSFHNFYHTVNEGKCYFTYTALPSLIKGTVAPD
jgi:hypothetical protein